MKPDTPERKALKQAVRRAELRVHAAKIKLEAARERLRDHIKAHPGNGSRIGKPALQAVSEALTVDRYKKPPEIALETGLSITSVRLALNHLVLAKRARRLGGRSQRTFYAALPQDTEWCQWTFLGGAIAAGIVAAAGITLPLNRPQIWGDGIHDDTEGLQALFDGKRVDVVADDVTIIQAEWIEIRGGNFKISKPLIVARSDMEIRLENCHFMLQNCPLIVVGRCGA